MNVVELVPEGEGATRRKALIVEWANQSGRETANTVIDADPFFTAFGNVPVAGIDLARTAVGAYLADRLIPRSSLNWSREIALVVHMIDPAGFAPATELLQTLLYWITGDNWTIVPIAGAASRPKPREVDTAPTVSLLSGGLDSLCGALLSDDGTIFVGQRDSKAVGKAQRLLSADLADLRGAFTYERLRVQACGAHERSSRSRSMMFTALGTALATARSANVLLVPENGFTSLNPPLAANRGGLHTTRSTHPTTLAYGNAVNTALGLDVRLENPYECMTKGELVRDAATAIGVKALEEIIPHSYSCATGNGQFFPGGSAFLNCGVCVACMTRRGSILSAGLDDGTQYLVDRLVGDARTQFLDQRGSDQALVRTLGGWQADDLTVTSIGPFPAGYDLEAARDLLTRGMMELVNGLP